MKEKIKLEISYRNSTGEFCSLELPVEKYVVVDIDKDIINIEKLNNSENFRFIISKALFESISKGSQDE